MRGCCNGRSFPLAFTRFAANRRGSNCSGGRCRCLRCSTPLRRRWRWRRRRWRSQRLQVFQRLGPRSQLAIKQQQEHIVRNLRICRHLRRDAQLRHLRQGNFLLHLPPLRKETLDLLRHGLLPRRDCQKQNHLRTRRRQQLPSPRRSSRFLARQPFCQAARVVFQIFPRFNQIFARNCPS